LAALRAAYQNFPVRTKGVCMHRNLGSKVQKREKRRKEKYERERKEAFS